MSVVVVGAGPVGLTTALALAHHGVPSTVVELEPRHYCEGSRSICVQRHSLEQLERIGAPGLQMAAEGVSWRVGRTYFRDRELFSITLGTPKEGELPPFVNLGQWRVEQLLLEEAERRPEVTLLWGRRLVGFEQDGDGVTAGLDDGTHLRGRYLVGCDGVKSAVRQLAGISFDGEDFADKFLICDIRAELSFPNERRFFFDPPFNPGRQVLVHPQPDNVWRVDWQVPPDFDLDADDIDSRIRAVIGAEPYEIVWASQYTFSQRMAGTFRQDRVFLAGDAAHVMTPFGARGLNSGVQDAINLAWKVAWVLNGDGGDLLLNSYDAERREAARENLAATGATMRFLVPPAGLPRLRREVVLRGALKIPGLRRYVDSGRLSEPAWYGDSPVVRPGGGCVMPDAWVVRRDGTWVRLGELVGHRLVVVWCGWRMPDFVDAFDRNPPTVPHELVFAWEWLPGVHIVRPDGHLAVLGEDAPGDKVAWLAAFACGQPHTT